MDSPLPTSALSRTPGVEQRTVATLAEAFALGRLFEARTLHAQTPSDTDLADLLETTCRDFVRLTARSDSDRRYLEALGLPSAVHPPLAFGLPSVAWTIPDTVANDSWSRASLQWDSLPDAPPIVPTQPFQVRDLGDFPPGTRVLAISEPRHAACATTADALRSQSQDLDRLHSVAQPGELYASLLRLRAWYTTTTNIAYGRLAQDHYRDWRPELALPLRYELISAEVARRGATSLSHRVLAMRMASHAFGEQFELALRAVPPRGDAGAYVLAHLVSVLESAIASNARVLQAFNLALAESSSVSTAGCVLMEVHRTPQDDQPRLAVIPDVGSDVSDLTQNGRTQS